VTGRALACAAVIGGLVLGAARGGVAASLVLDDAGKQAALTYGRASADRETFDAEWRVKNPAGDVVSVLTPFHRVAIAARHATFRNETLRPGEPDRLLRQQKDRLVLQAEVRGAGDDFARQLVPELILGERKLKPAFVQNDRAPLRLDDGGYLARCTYGFPLKELTGTSRPTLVLRDRNQREVSRFTIDLGKMR
jgi:hypothetical protein